MLNTFTASLAGICRTELLREKWLLCPSLRVGQQWLEAIVRSGQPCVNVHVKTLLSTAVDLAAPDLLARGLTPAPQRACILLIDRALREVRPQLKYLHKLEINTQLAEAIWRTVASLRLSGVGTAELKERRFEVAAKGRDLKLILQEYERLLQAAHLADEADVLQAAVARLRTAPDCLSAATLVLIPADLERQGWEEQFLAALPADRRRILAVDAPATAGEPKPKKPITADRDLLRWLFQPQRAPSPRGDGSLLLRRAVGEVHEVRQVLRQCTAAGIPWDEVELLHTDSGTYVPLVYETWHAVAGSNDGEESELPVTFSEGIPCTYSRPGRALQAWLAWIDAGYPQGMLVNMVREGLLTLPAGEPEPPGFARLAGVLRSVPIGLGRERYLAKLGEQLVGIENRLATDDFDDEREEDRTHARAACERKQRELRLLKTLVAGLLATTPEPETSAAEKLAAAERFLTEQARSVGKLDRFAMQKLVGEVQEIARWVSQENSGELDVGRWLAALPAGAAVLGSGPRPGCLHVAGISQGGHSGRPYTFLVGMDDSRFPGGGGQDPLLLDGERRQISANLPTAGGRLQETLERFGRLLARLRGTVTLSYACRSLEEDRELFPSPWLLTVFRLLSGTPTADQEAFLAALPTPAGFAPDDENGCLELTEWWLWRLTQPERIHESERLLLAEYPHLADGRTATVARNSAEFTPFDGLVPEAGADLDPTAPGGRVMSSSALQTLAGCPRKFFFQYALDIALPDETDVDTEQWLDALETGSLLHELFEEFLRDLIAARQLPEFARDWPDLRRRLEAKIEGRRELTPPPHAHAFHKRCQELEQVAATFLRAEAKFCREENSEPVFLEASLGMEADGHGTPLDTPEPIPLTLASGRTVYLKGRVDRIDRLPKLGVQTYGIWDYKTGGTWGFDRAEPFQQGRKIQPYLYVTMVAHCLRKHVHAQAEVRYFGFFFPGIKANGDRFSWTSDVLRDGKEILELLCQTLQAGAFPATNQPKTDCTYCDYRSICEPLESLVVQIDAKLAADGNELLEPFRLLRATADDDS